MSNKRKSKAKSGASDPPPDQSQAAGQDAVSNQDGGAAQQAAVPMDVLPGDHDQSDNPAGGPTVCVQDAFVAPSSANSTPPVLRTTPQDLSLIHI